MRRFLGLLVSSSSARLPLRKRERDPPPSRPWVAAAVTGVASSTFSSLAMTLGARRIARDPSVDWMEVGMACFGPRIIRHRPTKRAQAAGLLVHALADTLWSLAFFGLFARSRRRPRPREIVAAALPWAMVTTSIEYHLLLRWVQPWVRMQVPYWVTGVSRAVSGTGYPLFFAFDRGATEEERAFSERWARGLGTVLGGLAVMDAWARFWGEPTFNLRRPRRSGAEAQFIQQMTARQELGLDLAERAARRAHDRRLRELGRLMALEYAAQLRLMAGWWRSWFGGHVPPVSDRTMRHMEGMPSPDLLYQLVTTRGQAFDELFLAIMLQHHEGVVMMCDRLGSSWSIPQVGLMAHAIRHAQRGRIEEMENIRRTLLEDRAERVVAEG